jgi:hypothetical protein
MKQASGCKKYQKRVRDNIATIRRRDLKSNNLADQPKLCYVSKVILFTPATISSSSVVSLPISVTGIRYSICSRACMAAFADSKVA